MARKMVRTRTSIKKSHAYENYYIDRCLGFYFLEVDGYVCVVNAWTCGD